MAAGSDAQSLTNSSAQMRHASCNYLMRRSLRMGVVSREIETVVSGRVLHLAVTASSLGPRRANSGYVLVLDDLTEMLRAQKSAAWQEVARRIAHEIKNPLTPIQLSSQRLSRFLERRDATESKAPRDLELTKLVHECSRLIEREVSTLAALVNEFSQFVRFPTAKLIATNANTIVHEAVEVFSGRLDGITLKTTLGDNLPPVRADGGLLRSVVVNLIDNAAEALENSTFREILISTCAHPDAETVEICVSDTGHGISPQDKDKLFLPHFSTKNRGTGLGLAIAARIVAEHGGTIHVEDNLPAGSRFLVELPVAELTPAGVTDLQRDGIHSMTSKSHVLVVDDEAGIRESLSSILKDEGYHVEAVASAEEALQRAASGDLEVILLDVWLPGIDGLDALSRLQAIPRAPAVIMISGHGTIETAVRATKLGAFDFIEKPLSLEKIIVLVRNAVQQRQAPGRKSAASQRTRPSLPGYRGQRAHESAASADRRNRAHQRPRSDLRRKRHR